MGRGSEGNWMKKEERYNQETGKNYFFFLLSDSHPLLFSSSSLRLAADLSRSSTFGSLFRRWFPWRVL